MPADTFGHDIQVSDRYQQFSAEILRLALAGIAGIGFLLVNCLFGASHATQSLSNTIVMRGRLILLVSLSFFGISVLAALAHRFISTYSLSRQLLIMRLDIIGGRGKLIEAERQRRLRNRLFKIAWVTLGVGGGCLFSGAATLIWFFWTLMEVFVNN